MVVAGMRSARRPIIELIASGISDGRHDTVAQALTARTSSRRRHCESTEVKRLDIAAYGFGETRVATLALLTLLHEIIAAHEGTPWLLSELAY